LIAAGAAAGLAAAFGAPLAATVFVFEKYRMRPGGFPRRGGDGGADGGTADPDAFWPGAGAALFAPLKFPWIFCPWLLLLGAAAGLLGALLDKAIWGLRRFTAGCRRRSGPRRHLPRRLSAGCFFPRALGGGMDLIEHAEPAGAGVRMLLLFLAVKFLFTCVSYGSGVPGGVFLPVLALGALCGSLAAAAAVRFGLSPAYTADFAVCAMAARDGRNENAGRRRFAGGGGYGVACFASARGCLCRRRVSADRPTCG
jgi:H+/Cl- antiporter ClcA